MRPRAHRAPERFLYKVWVELINCGSCMTLGTQKRYRCVLHSNIDVASDLYIELTPHAFTEFKQSGGALDLMKSRKFTRLDLEIALLVGVHLVFTQSLFQ